MHLGFPFQSGGNISLLSQAKKTYHMLNRCFSCSGNSGGPDLPGDVIAFAQVFQLLWMHSGELVVTGVALDIVLEFQLLSQDWRT
ncbi:hypothetical protein TNIN_498411 [Trichonephila inaurata madagascariensis]|uniref:Uncharacterized protein n=1 Tax=Trichonephila inaurata madagascariensis TaxID=2747483 RepID=A0A8X6YSC5_9ARAC|nr:hypothetical protein TNIN_498411 [Trichonephila inaurata madagascariensis]